MRYAKIKENDVVNGEGISVSLFTQGCPHHCKGCFNSVTWDFAGGNEWTNETFDYLMECLDKNGIKRNLSILGGEPFCEQNAYDVIELTKIVKAKDPDRKVYAWTGYRFEELIAMYGLSNLSCIDYLIDGKFVEEEKDLTLKLRGSKNQRIIDVQSLL